MWQRQHGQARAAVGAGKLCAVPPGPVRGNRRAGGSRRRCKPSAGRGGANALRRRRDGEAFAPRGGVRPR